MGFFEVVLRPGRALREWLRPEPLPDDVPRGLPSCITGLTLPISVLISWAAVSNWFAGGATKSLGPTLVQLLVAAPITTGFLVVLFGVIGALVLGMSDYLGTRECDKVLQRSQRLFILLAAFATLFAALASTVRWQPQPPKTDGLGQFVLVLAELAGLLAVFVVFVWFMFAVYAVLVTLTLNRSATETIHPLLAPLVDAQLVIVGLASTLPSIMRGTTRGSDVIGLASSLVVAVVALADFLLFRSRALAQGRPHHCSDQRIPAQ
ncbi:MAG TPA: hypothetical protein VGO03_17515 [Acidimicrobiia bacterium]